MGGDDLSWMDDMDDDDSWMDDYGNAKYSQLVWEMILKFHEFWTTYNPKPVALESFVYSDEHKYAGTADIVCEIEGETENKIIQ